jgi:hypothetical protein
MLDIVACCKQSPRLDADRRRNILIELGQRLEILVNIGCRFTAQLAFYGTAPLFDDANAPRKCMNLMAELLGHVAIEPTTN